MWCCVFEVTLMRLPYLSKDNWKMEWDEALIFRKYILRCYSFKAVSRKSLKIGYFVAKIRLPYKNWHCNLILATSSLVPTINIIQDLRVGFWLHKKIKFCRKCCKIKVTSRCLMEAFNKNWIIKKITFQLYNTFY